MDFSSATDQRSTGRYGRTAAVRDALPVTDAATDDERDHRRTSPERPLRGGLTVAAGIVAGYLLWRRLGERGGPSTEKEPVDVRTVASRIRERATVEEVLGDLPTPAGTGEDKQGATVDDADERAPSSATVPDAVAGDDAEQAVGQLSPPTVRGMPMLGVGTRDHADYDECVESVGRALRVGFRHIDTTVQREAYFNEPAVGDAVADADVPREDVFVATKVDPADLDPEHVRLSVEESLDRLGMDHVDLLYPRWPTGEYEPGETMSAFADLLEEGHIRRIGVSNFTVDLLEEAIEESPHPVFADQVEMHPLLPQTELREFCDRDDVDVELVAHTPLARGAVAEVDELQAVAEKHGASPEQVSLAWLREKGVCAVPRATSVEHLRENWLSLAVDLDAEDVARIDAIDERRRVVDPDDAPWNR